MNKIVDNFVVRVCDDYNKYLESEENLCFKKVIEKSIADLKTELKDRFPRTIKHDVFVELVDFCRLKKERSCTRSMEIAVVNVMTALAQLIAEGEVKVI